ncbi:MAG: M50 family metallopeptidase, partial [Verrucomicrobiae bacterium]|nr:M50 family metallopeptidase [Verrucomicrobiae bacterium]
MAATTQTFSETWHRIARARVSLRPSVRTRRVHFRGERWHVLEDPFSNQFYRVRPAAYDFLARLDGRRTVEECWLESLEVHPDEAPGQEEVVQLLAQLFHGNLIRSDLSPDSAAAFQRFRKRRHREIKTNLQSILFSRLPLLDPDPFLKRTLPFASWLFNKFGLVLWLGVIGAAIKVAIDHWPELTSSSQSVIAPGNLPLLYVSLAFIKLIHELGHGYACRRFGGEVHVLGIMLLVFTPVPYVDASASWRFRSKWQRVVVASAGVYVELLMASVAVFVWASTGSGLVHSIAFNLIFIASVSTILFNVNPLLRFDGYYILSDLIGVPNLNQRANRQWKHLLEHTGFGIRRSVSPANSWREAAFYLIWGAAAWVYRLFLFAGILLFVADRFLLLGILIAITGVITWVFVPLFRGIDFLARNSRLERHRSRAIGVTLAIIAVVVTPLCLIPFPHSFSAPGILRSVDYNVVFTESPGTVSEIRVHSGKTVSKGETVVALINPALELEARGLAA